MRERSGARPAPRDRERAERAAVQARQALPVKAWAAGRALPLEQAVAFALEDEPVPGSLGRTTPPGQR